VFAFLFQAVAISLSGVMAPGPLTAAALANGTRSRHAGALVALGHAAVEFPLMFLIVGGMGSLFESENAKIGIGLAGGAFLLFMGVQMLRSAQQRADVDGRYGKTGPFWAGVILSAGNPYFLLWWATIGLALVTKALGFGKLTFGLFAIVHWLCDLIWLEALSLASFKGSKLLGERSQRIVLTICALALLLFGAMFIHHAGRHLVKTQVQAAWIPHRTTFTARTGQSHSRSGF